MRINVAVLANASEVRLHVHRVRRKKFYKVFFLYRLTVIKFSSTQSTGTVVYPGVD